MQPQLERVLGAVRCHPPGRSVPQPASGARWGLALAALLSLGAVPAAAPAGEPAAPAAAGSVFLEDLTWTELRAAVQSGHTVALIPIGGTEQSGPAIALGKHNVRVRVLAERIARELGNAIVAPVVAYVPEGSIEPPGSHMRFAGTISVPVPVFEGTLEAAARSLKAHGFRDIVLLGDHGGYQTQLVQVATRLDRSWAGQSARVWAPGAYYEAASRGFARQLRERGYADDEIGTHAALADTSLQLAVAPATVRAPLLAAAPRWDAAQGVYGGDPRRASAALGELGAAAIVHDTVAAVRELVAHGREHPPAAAPHPRAEPESP
jgi:creatinine amidohydrolase/Fe(II)-dependent formamide hydrolase-like protein